MDIFFKDIYYSDIINNYIAFLFLMIDVPIFISLFFVKINYGKFYNSDLEEVNWFQRLLRKYFPVISSKKAWIIQGSPGIFVTLFYIVYAFSHITLKRIIVIFPFFMHYIHRAFIFPFRIHSSENIPLEITIMTFISCFFNAIMINRSIFYFSNYDKEFWLFYIFGMISFGIGAYINIFSDYSMAKQRSENKHGLNGKYIIPKGFFFDCISCPNYFGEIIEWLSFIVISSSFGSLVCFVTNVSFLFPRSIQIHEWYKENFKNEFNNDKDLSERKAILPFLY